MALSLSAQAAPDEYGNGCCRGGGTQWQRGMGGHGGRDTADGGAGRRGTAQRRLIRDREGQPQSGRGHDRMLRAPAPLIWERGDGSRSKGSVRESGGAHATTAPKIRLRRQDVTTGVPTARTACQGNRCTAAGDVMVVDNDRGRYLVAMTTTTIITTITITI